MRRALVVLLALGMASDRGAADRPRPPGAAAAPSPDPLITDHEFDGYLWGDRVFCVHVAEGATTCCGKDAAEHAQMPEQVEDSG